VLQVEADKCDLNAVLFLRLVQHSERESDRNVLARTVDNKVRLFVRAEKGRD
jgi:hypothetical protein